MNTVLQMFSPELFSLKLLTAAEKEGGDEIKAGYLRL